MTALGIVALAFIAIVGAAGVGLVAWATATDEGIQRPRVASDDTNTVAHDGSPLPSGIEKGEDA